MTLAAELYEEARAALAEQRTDAADDLLRRARAACTAEQEELLLRIELSSGWVTFERDGPDAAVAQVQLVVTAASRAGLTGVAAAARAQVGMILARSGELGRALRALRGVDESALPPSDRVRLLLNRGALSSEARHLDDAVADLVACADLASDLGMPQFLFMATHNLGWVQFMRGDLPAALTAMREADELEADLDRSVSRLDRSRVLLEAGLIDEARALLAGIHTTDPHLAGERDLDLARALLLLGRRQEAADLARRAAEGFALRGEPAWARRCLLTSLLSAPDATAARSLLAEARGARDAWVAPHAAAALLSLADDRDDREDLRAATRQLARSPVVSRRIAGLAALAADSMQRGDRPLALRQLRNAHATLLRAQLGSASLDLRAATALHGTAAAALDLELAFALTPGRRVAAAVSASERWRAALRPLPSVEPASDQRVAVAASHLRRARAAHHADPDDSAAGAAMVEAERELSSLTWLARSEPDLPTMVPFASLRRAVRESGAALAVAIPRGDEVWLAMLGQGSERLVRLGLASEIAAAVMEVSADLTARAKIGAGHPLAAVVDASLRARLAVLSALVGAPLKGSAPLVIVPSGALAGVPWLALPDLAGRSVTVTPAASSWATSGVEITDPVVAALGGPGLPLADAELASVAAAWGPTIGGPLTQALATADVVHIASHGTHRADAPLFSSLRLEEGVVVAHELERVPLRASHIVLSACEVGRATHRAGDQPLGLTAALLARGVACVIAPVAPVADATAAQTMSAYHEGLAAGLDAATALAVATAGQPAAGAFTCFGASWRATRRIKPDAALS